MISFHSFRRVGLLRCPKGFGLHDAESCPGDGTAVVQHALPCRGDALPRLDDGGRYIERLLAGVGPRRLAVPIDTSTLPWV